MKGKPIAVLGLAFKANTDDVRFSPAIDLIQDLLAEGAHVRAFDPEGSEKARAVVPQVKISESPYEAAKDAEALIIATEWKQFRDLDWQRIHDGMTHPFVVDARNILRGALGLDALLAREPDTPVAAAMAADVVSFTPEQPAAQAAQAFERYDLISAPVVDERGKLVGRVTVDRAVDFMRQEAEQQALSLAGLRGEEDLFASVWESAKNRWPWVDMAMRSTDCASAVWMISVAGSPMASFV